MEEEKKQNFEVEETPTQPIEQLSENTTIKEFKLPSWWLKFSDSCSRLSKRLQRSFDRLLFALDEEQKEKLKKNLYYLVCFIGFVGYAIFIVIVLGSWLFFDFIVGIIKLQKKTFFRENDGSLANEGTNFVLGGIITILEWGKAVIAFIIRRIGWGDFDFSRNGIIRVIRNLFKEVRPSQTTFRFGVLTLIIVGYITVKIAIGSLQTFAMNTQENALNVASKLRFPSAYEKIKNAEYKFEGIDFNDFSSRKTIKLNNGIYEYGQTSAIGDRAFVKIDKIAFGDIDKDGKDDAAVAFVRHQGGNSHSMELTALLDYKRSSQPTNNIAIADGARTDVKQLFISNHKIIVKALELAPSDPFCCPSLEVKRVYQYNGQILEKLLTDNNNQQPPQYEGDYYEEDSYNNAQPLQPESATTPQSEQFASSPTPTPSILPSPTLSPSDQTNATIIGEPGYKNIRSGPGTNYSKRHIAYPGDRVQILESAQDSEGYIWYKIYFPKSRAEGWIARQLLSPD
jgi:hypothetical protein